MSNVGRFWLKLYYKDILSDEALSLLSMEEMGLWVRLLCIAARSPVQGKILTTKKRGKTTKRVRPTWDELATLLRLTSGELCRNAVGTLRERCVISCSRGGVLYFKNWRKYQGGRHLEQTPVVSDSCTTEKEKEKEKEGARTTRLEAEEAAQQAWQNPLGEKA
ncbi:MAG: hypothetical protein WC683_05940 [bacterium]